MILPVKIPGLAFICSLCDHMAQAAENGLEDCGKADCGGLSVGRAFPLYKGPLEAVLLEYCHRCGEESAKVLEVDRHGRLGICEKCLKNILDNGGVEM